MQTTNKTEVFSEHVNLREVPPKNSPLFVKQGFSNLVCDVSTMPYSNFVASKQKIWRFSVLDQILVRLS